MPYILTTFANDQRNFLEDLWKEDDQVQGALLPGFIDGRYTVFRESFVTRDILVDRLRLLRYGLFCFHFSGHADENLLQLGDGNVRAEGVLGLLSSCLPNLKLVVLNGCGTLQQAEALHSAGIPCVIATTAPVDDAAATDFSIAFYRELMQGQTIQSAFDRGLDVVKLRREVTVLRTPPDKGNNVAPGTWCFFSKDGGGQKVLPVAAEQSLDYDFKPNSILVPILFKNTNLHSRQLRRLREDIKEGIQVSGSKRRMAIVNCLPAPVGEVFRKLLPLEKDGLGYNQLTVLRLQQIVKTYVTTMELLTYTLLAQLFEHILTNKQSKVKLPPVLHQEIQDFLLSDNTAKSTHQYIYFIKLLHHHLVMAKSAFFVAELANLGEIFSGDKSRFTIACAEIEALRLRLNLVGGQIPVNLIGPLCKEAEEHLAEVISQLGFISKYTMATIRNIDVIKYRHQPAAQFMHELIKLIDVQGGEDVSSLRISAFMDNRSVLLIKDPKQIVLTTLPPFLNLSPFIMDRCAFEPDGDASNLHFLSKVDLQEKKITYRALKERKRTSQIARDNDLWPVYKRKKKDPEEEEADPMLDLPQFRQGFVYEQFETFLRLLDEYKFTAS